ncbi:carbon-nitrogen hydrolase domain-containing protein [Sarocladium implicatum]|nr:carbon-nitrogen hydrolase domain-containing protein [Sarocladium implicatum]
MTGTIRLGTASPATQATTAATLAQINSIASRAAAAHADFLLLPEAYIGGYPRGTAFGCVIGDRSAEGREEYAQYFEQSVDLGDTVGNGAGAGEKWVKRQLGAEDEQRGDGTREELERIARDTGVFIVVGCIERAGGSLYCSAVYVCPKEGMIGKRRKVMPTGTERLIWAQGCPSTLKAVSTTIRGTRVNLAAAICWENYMPLLRQTLYSQNVNLYLAPTADGREAWMGLMRTIGVEGRCFVISSNMCVRSGDSGEQEVNGANQANGSRHFTANRARRRSTITEEGHEIALPGAGRVDQKKKRRKSIIDENGNEIVLCCDEGGEDAVPSATDPISLTNGQSKTKVSSFVSRGGSSIVGPFGDVLAGPQWEDEDGLVYADVDFRDCIKGRLDLDAAGSYSRNDSFKFSVQGLDLDPLPY